MTQQTVHNKIAVGVDIGTTTISTIVLDEESGGVLQTSTIPNDTVISSEFPWEHMQSPEDIWKKVKELLDEILENFTVSSIGVTGQMHGIMYTAPDGTPLSPLYTWQDGRAGYGENSTCGIIRKETGYTVPGGYGLATHYHLLRNKQTPAKPYYCSTIMDFVTMKLCGLSRPVIHISNAASWGFYKDDIHNFDEDTLCKLEIDCDVLPEVTADTCILGTYNDIPVSVAIGDNQAAFIGAAAYPEHTVLVNIGTGSQISMLAEKPLANDSLGVESRPFDGEKYLLSGSCLCGGRAYAFLENFFRQYMVAAGYAEVPQYNVLNLLAEKGRQKGTVLTVQTTFCGTRVDPSIRGQITGIGEENFTPEAIAAGVLYGMAEELYEMYCMMPKKTVHGLIASGNAVRKNPVLQQILSEKFELPLQISENAEEAACGAARFGKQAADQMKTSKQLDSDKRGK